MLINLRLFFHPLNSTRQDRESPPIPSSYLMQFDISKFLLHPFKYLSDAFIVIIEDLNTLGLYILEGSNSAIEHGRVY